MSPIVRLTRLLPIWVLLVWSPLTAAQETTIVTGTVINGATALPIPDVRIESEQETVTTGPEKFKGSRPMGFSVLEAIAILLAVLFVGSRLIRSPVARLMVGRRPADVQVNLGFRYAIGEGVPQDATEAVRWYRLAADQGNAEGQNFLGAMYGKTAAASRRMRRRPSGGTGWPLTKVTLRRSTTSG